MNFNNSYRPTGFGYLPTATRNILIINIVLFIGTILMKSIANIDLIRLLGLHHHLASDFQPYQFVTHMFMHATTDEAGNFSVLHILLNMFGLYMLGPLLENLWGSKRFLSFYLLCGLGSAALHYGLMHFKITAILDQMNQSLQLVSSEEQSQIIEMKEMILNNYVAIGASGALYGLLGAIAMIYPDITFYIYFLVPVKAKWFAVIFGGIALISGLMDKGDSVAHFGHLGGLVTGVLIVLMWRSTHYRQN